MFELEGLQDGDHFKIRCKECQTETENEYLGASMFRSTCPKCNQTNNLKLGSAKWRGLPPHKSN